MSVHCVPGLSSCQLLSRASTSLEACFVGLAVPNSMRAQKYISELPLAHMLDAPRGLGYPRKENVPLVGSMPCVSGMKTYKKPQTL
jgi:hypothetical protein